MAHEEAAAEPTATSLPETREETAIRRVLKSAAGVTAIVAGAVLFWYTAQVLLVFFLAIFLAIFFSGLAKLLHEHSSFTYRGSLAFVLLGLLGIFIIAMCMVGPAIAQQSSDLSVKLPQAFHQLIADMKQNTVGNSIVAAGEQAINTSKGDNLEKFVKFAGVGMQGIGGMVFGVVIAIFLAADPALYRGGALKLLPPARQARGGEVLDELGFTLWWWLIAQLGVMASVGTLVGIGLTVLGVPLSGTLGLIAALLSFIPSLGPFISVIPAILIGISVHPITGLWVAILYAIVQTLEANLISPLIQQRAISLPPALIMSAELLMGLLLGGAGLAFATPLAAVGLVLVNMLYVENVLHQKGSLPSEKREAQKSGAEDDKAPAS